ncbi:hypothetical protein RIB2604_00800270 [Aspergillus luchuensis]|uniref:Uncharacterized protein n=1 Tax=Aspergillus kawachii TaxID=1069201 RepID=A0A146F366_ASPKA|nr:hypothetical protein RIB2604_00800270 [Aspergillus luchuensis]
MGQGFDAGVQNSVREGGWNVLRDNAPPRSIPPPDVNEKGRGLIAPTIQVRVNVLIVGGIVSAAGESVQLKHIHLGGLTMALGGHPKTEVLGNMGAYPSSRRKLSTYFRAPTGMPFGWHRMNAIPPRLATGRMEGSARQGAGFRS